MAKKFSAHRGNFDFSNFFKKYNNNFVTFIREIHGIASFFSTILFHLYVRQERHVVHP